VMGFEQTVETLSGHPPKKINAAMNSQITCQFDKKSTVWTTAGDRESDGRKCSMSSCERPKSDLAALPLFQPS